jgi:hypothetical protein
MIVMSDVNGTPRKPGPDEPDNRDYHGVHAGGPHDPYNDDVADQLADDHGTDDRERGLIGRLWQAFAEWVDEYAWTIIILGVALILLDVLFVLTILLWQVNR